MRGRNEDYEPESDGEQIEHSDQFKDYHKGCTDIACCCLWVICLIAFAATIGYGFMNGNPKRLHHGIDNVGRVCGVDVGVELLPFTYFCPPNGWVAGSLTSAGLALTNPVCVAACPLGVTETDAVLPATIPQCAPNFTATAYKTIVQMNYCLPDSVIHQQAASAVTTAMSGAVPTVMKAGDSILKGYPIYIVMFLLAVVMGYAYICCLKVFARLMIYLAMIVAFFGLAIIGVWMIIKAPEAGTNEVMSQNFGQFATSMAYMVGGLCSLAAVGILCLVCCCFSQIDHAVIAVQMTTDVMSSIPSLLVAPVVKAIFKFTLAAILAVGFVYLISCAHPTPVLGSTVLREFKYESSEWGMIFFYAFMFFWVMSFVTALYQFAVAYATADYYFAYVDYDGAPGDRDVGCCGVVEGLCVGLMWHQGSFAFGSFIIAIFSMVQRVLEYIKKSNPNNPCVSIITCCLWCCITACKSCAEFVNKNAYIGIAIKGYSFCRACQKAFEVMIKNAAGMAILNGATFVFQIAGLLLITTSCLFIADIICQLNAFTDPSSSWFLPHPAVVVGVSGVIGFAMAKIFMDVFDMVSDTLMYCFGLEGFNGASQKCPEPVRQAFAEAKMLENENR